MLQRDYIACGVCDSMLRIILSLTLAISSLSAAERLRVMIETDAGGDPDDEQSLVRFLLYTSEFDIEGIIATRPDARNGENLNKERTGLGILRAQLNAYGACFEKLRQHDQRFPAKEFLWERTVPGYDGVQDGENLIIQAIDSPDPRPLWFCNWGTDKGSSGSSLKRALDRILRDRGPEGYAKFKNRLRLSSADKFDEHTTTIQPPFRIWVDTFRPELEKKRWYWQFSAITATAGGFDLKRDVLTNHGPLGALYPTNTTHRQKEGDTGTFLYLVPTGMNDPDQPGWGSWAGRYGLMQAADGFVGAETPRPPYFWANQKDLWRGTTTRDNTLARWAVHLQNDFRARMDWCVRDYAEANHAPRPAVRGGEYRKARGGDRIELDASESRDPDGNALKFEWMHYREAGTLACDIEIEGAERAKAVFAAPITGRSESIHVILIVTDYGSPPLTRYKRVIVNVEPK